jgi:hypothetical protein
MEKKAGALTRVPPFFAVAGDGYGTARCAAMGPEWNDAGQAAAAPDVIASTRGLQQVDEPGAVAHGTAPPEAALVAAFSATTTILRRTAG